MARKRTDKSANGQPPTHEQDPLISCAETARQIGKSPQTVARWCREGLLRAVKMPSGHYGVRQSQINQLLQASEIDRRVEPPTPDGANVT
jgi:hypothetical protein